MAPKIDCPDCSPDLFVITDKFILSRVYPAKKFFILNFNIWRNTAKTGFVGPLPAFTVLGANLDRGRSPYLQFFLYRV
jgi:hypothetical protein